MAEIFKFSASFELPACLLLCFAVEDENSPTPTGAEYANTLLALLGVSIHAVTLSKSMTFLDKCHVQLFVFRPLRSLL